ncbi:MAG: HAD-IIIA family hydrolase [Spirochaetaceae bacterium]|nr:MAG: HAD-IIIA family hydrolase [Spirochaetaceae bacterium]
MQAVMMVGGKGTRLKSYTDKIPKPMIPIGDKPILLHQIETMKRYGIDSIIMVLGYKGEIIKNYFKNGKDLSVHIQYIEEDVPLGTAGSFVYLKDRIGEDFLLVFGDVFFDIDLSRFIRFHYYKKSLATLLCHPNSHPDDSDLIVLNPQDQVTGFDSKNNQRNYYYRNCVNAGLYVLNHTILNTVTQPEKTDLDKDILLPLIDAGSNVFAYRTSEYAKDMGTEERLIQVETDYRNGVTRDRNLCNKQKCIFLDRDGTLNRYKGFISDINELELEDGAAEAIRLINQSSYLCIVITNQPVIARNLCTVEQLDSIHNKMETLLGKAGAYLDDLHYCPHHPDKGFPEENPLYKMDCQCRKPKTGLIEASITKYNIDPKLSYMIGDSTTDIQTAKNAGLAPILILTGEAGLDGKYPADADMTCPNLLAAVRFILDKKVR